MPLLYRPDRRPSAGSWLSKRGLMNLYASGEDYLEAILVLYKKFGSVRSVDIARHMEVSKPSVCHAVNILKEGFLTIDENHFLYLTSQGKVVAEKIYERHRFFTEELIEAGVDPRQAETDACKMEHVISDQSFPKLKEQKEKNRLLLNLFTAYVVKSVEGKRTTEIQNAISRLVKGKTVLIIVTNVYTKRKNTNA